LKPKLQYLTGVLRPTWDFLPSLLLLSSMHTIEIHDALPLERLYSGHLCFMSRVAVIHMVLPQYPAGLPSASFQIFAATLSYEGITVAMAAFLNAAC